MATHRTSIINACLKELSRHKKVVGSEAIAATLKVDESQVRSALTRYARIHPDGPVIRVAVGFFRWNEDAQPVSAPPTTHVQPPLPPSLDLTDEERAMFHEAAQVVHALPMRERVVVPPSSGYTTVVPPAHTCEFTVVKRTSDVVLLTEEATQTLWAARKI